MAFYLKLNHSVVPVFPAYLTRCARMCACVYVLVFVHVCVLLCLVGTFGISNSNCHLNFFRDNCYTQNRLCDTILCVSSFNLSSSQMVNEKRSLIENAKPTEKMVGLCNERKLPFKNYK